MAERQVRDASVADPPTPAERLTSWQRQFLAQVDGIDLLGELDLTENDRAEIASLLRALLAEDWPEAVTNAIERKWPLVLAAYLVAEGIASYDAGNFWEPICERTGLPGTACSRWGQIFERAVSQSGKPTFADMVESQRATRYVAPILAHGGIPDRCLDDFFRSVLHHRVHGERWMDSDAADLVAEWRSQRDPLPSTNKPVKRFLMFGGGVAHDFLDRALEMARVASDGPGNLSSIGLGLPERVIERYRTFLSELPSEERAQGPGGSRAAGRFARPYLRFDPWGGVELVLPEQSLPEQPTKGLVWAVSGGGPAGNVPVRVRRRGQLLVTTAETIGLPRPAVGYSVTLSDGREVLRRWELAGMDARRPVLAFAPDSGRQIDIARALPAQSLWLIMGRAQRAGVVRARSAGVETAQETEALPPLGGEWATYRAAALNLHGVEQLVLGGDDVSRLSIPVRAVLPEPARPRLTGGNLVTADAGAETEPLYAGDLPDLVVPLDSDAALARWHIDVRSVGRAVFTAPQTTHLADVPGLTRSENVAARVPLARILGEDAMGSFVVSLRGPLGQDASLRMRILPSLEIDGADRLVLPGDPGAVTVTIDSGHRLIADGDDTKVEEPISGQDGASVWTVHPAASVKASPLELDVRCVRALNDGAMVEVPVRIQIRRLRWMLLGVAGADSRLDSRLVSIAAESITEADDPRIAIEAPHSDGAAFAIQVALVDSSGELQETAWAAGSGERTLVSLRAFRDTVRSSKRATLTLALRVRDRNAEPNEIQAARFVQALGVEQLAVELIEDEPQTLEASWREVRAFADRAMLVWSLRRPWEPPLQLKLPDDATSLWEVVVQPPLAPGRYRAALIAVDPWVGVSEMRLPPPSATGVADFRILAPAGALADGGGAEETLDQLLTCAAGDPPPDLRVEEVLVPLLSGELEREYGSSVLPIARSYCRRDATDLVMAVGNVAPALSVDQERLLVPILAEAGLGSWSRGSDEVRDCPVDLAGDLWRIWPPLGLFADLDLALDGDVDAIIRCRHGLGPGAFESIDEEATEEGPVVLGGTPSGLHGLLGAAQGARTPTARTIAPWSGDLLGGLLGGVALVQARYQSVILVKGNQDLEALTIERLGENLPALRRIFAQVRERECAPKYLIDEVWGRNEGEGVLRNVPFLSAIAAMLQRLAARRPGALIGIVGIRQANGLGNMAAQVAPLLYQRDLCFAELSLAIS